MTDCFDVFRKNKTILNEVNDAVEIFNDTTGKYSDEQRWYASGAIKMEEIICEELRKEQKKSQNIKLSARLLKNKQERVNE